MFFFSSSFIDEIFSIIHFVLFMMAMGPAWFHVSTTVVGSRSYYRCDACHFEYRLQRLWIADVLISPGECGNPLCMHRSWMYHKCTYLCVFSSVFWPSNQCHAGPCFCMFWLFFSTTVRLPLGTDHQPFCCQRFGGWHSWAAAYAVGSLGWPNAWTTKKHDTEMHFYTCVHKLQFTVCMYLRI